MAIPLIRPFASVHEANTLNKQRSGCLGLPSHPPPLRVSRPGESGTHLLSVTYDTRSSPATPSRPIKPLAIPTQLSLRSAPALQLTKPTLHQWMSTLLRSAVMPSASPHFLSLRVGSVIPRLSSKTITHRHLTVLPDREAAPLSQVLITQPFLSSLLI